jgi:hypothetical protein
MKQGLYFMALVPAALPPRWLHTKVKSRSATSTTGRGSSLWQTPRRNAQDRRAELDLGTKTPGNKERSMKQALCCIAISLLAVLAISLQMAAQAQSAQPQNEHVRYQLIDMGTFGGPHSYGSVNGDGFRLLNDAGVVSSYADTARPDPTAPNFCYNPDCFMSHAFRWKNGDLTDIGALPGMNSSAAGAINARGWSVGQSQSSMIDPVLGIPEFRAVLWKHDGVINLGTLPGGTESLGIYINDGVQVIGFSDNGVPDPFSFPFFFTGTQIHTLLWEDGVMQDIGTLGGPDAAVSAGCNNQRESFIVGASYTDFKPNASTGVPTLDPYLGQTAP